MNFLSYCIQNSIEECGRKDGIFSVERVPRSSVIFAILKYPHRALWEFVMANPDNHDRRFLIISCDKPQFKQTNRFSAKRQNPHQDQIGFHSLHKRPLGSQYSIVFDVAN